MICERFKTKKRKRECYLNLLDSLIITLTLVKKSSGKVREVALNLPQEVCEKIKELAISENMTFGEKVAEIAIVGTCKEIIAKLRKL